MSVGPFSATVEWAGASPPPRLAYGLPDLGPTMWAPVESGRASLTGLRFSTVYRVWGPGATLDLTTAPPPDSPAAAIGGGAVLLDGQPFFPLIVLAQCPSGYGSTLAAGISLYAENPCGGIADQSAALAGRALSLTAADEAGIGGPGVIGWYYPDEADLKGMTGATLPQFPTLAATARLRVLTVTNHFYSRTAPLAGGRGIYPGLIAKADVVGFDLYPLQEFCRADWLPDVARSQAELVRLAGGRPTFQWIEAQTWKCGSPALRVTPETVRAESWLSVAGGARGIGFFPADWDPAVTPAIAQVAKDAEAFGAGLVGPDSPSSATPPVIAAARTANGALYVIAVNPTRRSIRARIEARGLGGGRLESWRRDGPSRRRATRSRTTSRRSPLTSTSPLPASRPPSGGGFFPGAADTMSRPGAVAERLGRGLQSLVQRFESARRLDSRPLRRCVTDPKLDAYPSRLSAGSRCPVQARGEAPALSRRSETRWPASRPARAHRGARRDRAQRAFLRPSRIRSRPNANAFTSRWGPSAKCCCACSCRYG